MIELPKPSGRCAAEESDTGRSCCEVQCFSCKRWWPRKTEFRLGSVAPRLALARDQRAVEIRVGELEEARLATLRLGKDRLVAHRELQAIRAGTTGSRSYVKRRFKKLERAKRERKALGK